MAKLASINRDLKRAALVQKYAKKRAALQAIVADQSVSEEDRYQARLKLQQLPRNSNPTRLRNRCEVTGRPRAFYGKMRMSRIAVRELGSRGLIPGLVKSSW